jgi:hypothetical protein
MIGNWIGGKSKMERRIQHEPVMTTRQIDSFAMGLLSLGTPTQ